MSEMLWIILMRENLGRFASAIQHFRYIASCKLYLRDLFYFIFSGNRLCVNDYFVIIKVFFLNWIALNSYSRDGEGRRKFLILILSLFFSIFLYILMGLFVLSYCLHYMDKPLSDIIFSEDLAWQRPIYASLN